MAHLHVARLDLAFNFLSCEPAPSSFLRNHVMAPVCIRFLMMHQVDGSPPAKPSSRLFPTHGPPPAWFSFFPAPQARLAIAFHSSSLGQLSSTARQASTLFLLHAHVHGRGHSSPSLCRGHGRPLWQCDLLLCTCFQRVKLNPCSHLQPLFNGHTNAFTRNNA